MGDTNGDIKVSVYCLAYNHGKYIRNALKGLVKQRTNFRYEVFVHDDASTDNTAEIIREYAEKYPDIIRPIYQTENQYSKGVKIMPTYILPKMSGRYIAVCEGDDFWTDDDKLQLQVDALEAHPECAVCHAKVDRTDVQGNIIGLPLPPVEIKSGVIKSKDYLALVAYAGPCQTLTFQLSGAMMRKDIYEEYIENKPGYAKMFRAGDIPMFLYMGMKGDAFYINRSMSCYRTGNPESFVGRMGGSAEKKIKHYEAESDALRAFDEYSGFIVHEAIENGIKNRRFSILRATHDIPAMRSREMRAMYRSLPIKARFKEWLCCYFPWVMQIMGKLKKHS